MQTKPRQGYKDAGGIRSERSPFELKVKKQLISEGFGLDLFSEFCACVFMFT